MKKPPPVKRATPPRAPRKKEESNLLAEIRNTFGARPDVLLVRINTGVFDARGGYKVRSAPNGYPDLQLVQRRRVKVRYRTESNFSAYEEDRWHYYGQAIYIETKTKRGVMSKEQTAFMNAAVKAGAIYVLARSMEDVERELGPVPEWAKVRSPARG